MTTPAAGDPDCRRPAPRTRAVRAGIGSDTTHHAVTPPIYLSTTYTFESLTEHGRYDYSRAGNPTRDLFGEAVAALEGGASGCVAASGMGAITAALLALLPPGGRLLAPSDCYGGSWRLFDALERSGRLSLRLVDFSDPDAAASAIAEGADLVWLETPSNPLLRTTDLAAVAAAAHAVGALVAADNTFATPLLQRPLEAGVDVVVHSATKYLSGHSDVVAGVIVAADAGLADQLAWWANTIGVTGGAFDSYLALRGLRTLDLRVAAAQAGAEAVVELLSAHPAVRAVHYPGFGAMVTFELADRPAVDALLERLTLFCLAESLGGVESLVSHPATMTHAALSPQAQAAAGITDGMLRLSIGIEEPADLVADLRAALDGV